MLPGALYDPDLEPSYPPLISHDLSQHEKDVYLEWWNHDKVASFILTSHLFFFSFPICPRHYPHCQLPARPAPICKDYLHDAEVSS